MKISTNYSDTVELQKEDGTTEVVAYLNGNLSEDRTFSMSATVRNYDLFIANKATVTDKIVGFVNGVIDNVVSNYGGEVVSETPAVNAATDTTTETATTGSEE